MRRILILTGDAAETLEVYYALFRIREEGWQAEIAAPTKKRLKLVVHDFEEGWETYTEKPGHTIAADLAISEVDPTRYDGLIIPGGRAPEYIRNCPGAIELVRSFVDAGKPVAALCHGPLCLLAAGVVKGRKLSAYGQLACDIRSAGAEFVDDEAVVDAPLITGRTWADLPAFMREFIRMVREPAGR